MDEIERITVSVPLTDELREALNNCEFPNADAAVETAVAVWTADRLVERIGVERLRRHWDDGQASGDPQPLDIADIRRRIDKRAQEIRDAAGP